MAKTEIWKCPKCRMTVKIKDRKSKAIQFKLSPSVQTHCFPTHKDCQLYRPINKMDFSKLVKVGEE